MVDPRIEFVVELTEKDIAGMYDETSARWRKRCLLPGIAVSIAAIAGIVLRPDWVFENPANDAAAFAGLLVGILLIYGGTFRWWDSVSKSGYSSLSPQPFGSGKNEVRIL